MTEVAFHFGAPDKLAYVCRLLRKAVNAGAKVLVVAPEAALPKLDVDLWALSPAEFLPHRLATEETAGEGSAQDRSPIVLASHASQSATHRQVLVNLTDAVPDGFAEFARVIEVVGLDDADRAQARARWKQYTALGYTIVRHDLALKS